jgi:hypothetical protein
MSSKIWKLKRMENVHRLIRFPPNFRRNRMTNLLFTWGVKSQHRNVR